VCGIDTTKGTRGSSVTDGYEGALYMCRVALDDHIQYTWQKNKLFDINDTLRTKFWPGSPLLRPN